MKILVTGASGFVGSWLRPHLMDSGDEVVELSPDADVRDFDQIAAAVRTQMPDAIIHLAGIADVGASWKDSKTTFEVNATGTLSVLQAAVSAGNSPRVLLVSSAEVYGDTKPEQLPMQEGAVLRPVSPYAASKVAAEILGRQHFRAYGLPVVIARPFNHIGPRQTANFAVAAFASRIVAAINNHESEIVVGDLSTRRDFTDVRDVVRAYRFLINEGEPGECYNICSGEDIAMQSVVDKLIEMSGANISLTVDPELLRPAATPIMRGDNSRLVAATGWRRQFSLDQSLKDVLEFWKSAVSNSVEPISR